MSSILQKSQATISSFAPHARVWIYKAPRALSTSEVALVKDKGQEFTSTWAAHGAALKAAVEVLHDRFIVIAVDEQQAQASGCSIDSSVAFIRGLEEEFNITLTNRMLLWYELEGEIESCQVNEVEDLLAEGTLTAETIVFDDLVTTVGDLNSRFRIPMKDSWLSRYL